MAIFDKHAKTLNLNLGGCIDAQAMNTILFVKLLLWVTAGLSITLGSCVRVKPYQRQTHALRSMQDQDVMERKLDEHVNEYREGAVGGSGVGGGGCGCN